MTILILLTIGLTIYFYSLRCLDAPISPRVRMGLMACRVIFLVFLLFLLTLPQIRDIRNIKVPPVLYVALDDSLSMGYSSEPPEDENQPVPSRLEIAMRELQQGGMIGAWKKRGFELRYGLFPRALSSGKTESSVWFSDFPASATPTVPQTNLDAVIRHFSEAVSLNTPSYLLLFTDGRWNLGRNPLSFAASLQENSKNVPLPVYSFGIGTTEPIQDIRVDSIQLPAVARSGQTLVLQAHIRWYGAMSANSLTVHLRGENRQGDQVLDQSQPLAFPADGDETTVLFPLPELSEGQYLFTVEIDPLPHEWIVSNNHMQRGLQIRDAKDKVLLLTSSPDWEFKFLKRLLEDQETLDLFAYLQHENGLTRLGDRQWIQSQSVSVSTASQEEQPVYTRLEDLQGDLNRWPVIILHDFVFQLDHIEFLRSLKTYVENGGGLIFVPGHNNENVPVAAIREAAPPAITRSFSPQASAIPVRLNPASGSPFLALLQDNPQLDLPPLESYMIAYPQEDIGQVLLPGGTADVSVPLVTLNRYGLGRIVTMCSRSFWRWNLLTGRNILAPFWLTALYQASPRLQQKTGEIQTDGFLYNVFDPVRITYAAGQRIGDTTPESGVALTVSGPERRETVWMTAAGTTPGIFETRFTPDTPGTYQAATLTGDASAEFRVENTAIELRDLRQNVEDLLGLAEATGGEYADSSGWQDLANRLPFQSISMREERSHFLGEKWWMASVLILFLGLEWFLRWRKGLP